MRTRLFYCVIAAALAATVLSLVSCKSDPTKPKLVPPIAPSSLVATTAGQTSINLHWSDNASNEAGCYVERSLSQASGFSRIATLGSNATAYTATGLTASTTYYFRVRAYNTAGSSSYSNVASARTNAVPLSPPVLTGPSSVNEGVMFTLTWTYNWPSCTFCPSTSGYRLEESSTSATAGFSQIWESYLTGDRQSPKQLSITAHTAGTYWYRVRAFDNGWTPYSNVLTVTVVRTVSATRFVNNTSYPIVSLRIDGGAEQFPVSPMGIAPGSFKEIELAPGSHTVSATNGFWDGSSRFSMYTWNGPFTQVAGQVGSVTFSDPAIEDLLTRFSSSQLWNGDYWQNLQPHTAGFRFYSNGSYNFYDDGRSIASGTYSLVSRNPSAFTVTFQVNGFTGTLYETLGYFTMRNGPAGWELIQYLPVGALTTSAESGVPLDVPLRATTRTSIR